MPLSAAENANIARHLSLKAAAQPARAALKIPRGRTRSGDIDYLALTFAELDAEVSAWAMRLVAAGINRGDRTLVMVRQGLPLIASAFALFRIGAVPVIIDPGMGLKSFLSCVERSRPRALVGIPVAQLISRLFRRPFSTVATRVTASSSLTARLTESGPRRSAPSSQLVNSTAAELAAVLFTSGSTGAPKGVCYEHGMFDAQVRLIRETYAIAPGEIDLPLLPIFALFNPALGMTTIVPEIDPRHPAAIDPAKIVQAIRQENVTNSFGSPTLWRKIGDHCLAQNLTLPSLRRVLCAGAPVPRSLWESSRTFLPNGELHSPYGATESLPVSTISSTEIAALTRSECHIIDDTSPSSPGACVGRPVRGMDVRVIAISDAPIATLADARELPAGEIGEIIVRGPVVTKAYDANPAATAAAKIALSNSQSSILNAQLGADSAGTVFHRLGDCGYLDAAGRLWFCGRKVERVETASGPLFTEPVEQVFRRHPRVVRCALIGLEVGRDRRMRRKHTPSPHKHQSAQRPALIVEIALRNSVEARALARELRELARQHPATSSITLFYFRKHFPVDVRHNAKIHRLALAKWAQTAKGFESDPKR